MQRKTRAAEDHWIDPYADEAPARRNPVVGYALAGATLVAAFAIAGNYMGQNAVARTAPYSQDEIADLVSPATTSIVGKGSLLVSSLELQATRLSLARDQEIVGARKSDFLGDDSFLAPTAEETYGRKGSLAVSTPSGWQLESSFKIARDQKQKLIVQRKFRLAEQDCLARAIYFEARSESEMGQLAVAKVVLNRVKDPSYPKTICGVVYQGSDRQNACQFSFACDGISDQPRTRVAWDRAKRLASRAIAGDQSINILGAATYYHADYVTPKWSSSFKRLIKIGRHIFYTDS